MPRQRQALLLTVLFSLLVWVEAGDLDPAAGASPEQEEQYRAPPPAPLQQEQQMPPPEPIQAPHQEEAQASPPVNDQIAPPNNAVPLATPAAAPANDVPSPSTAAGAIPAVPVAPDVVVSPVPPTEIPLTPRQPVEINDPIVLKAAALAMVGVNPVEGKAIGWRVVHADMQSFVAGVTYYLQIELRTKSRCEVHEKKVFVEAKTGNLIPGGLGDLLPCDPSLPPADYMVKKKKWLRT